MPATFFRSAAASVGVTRTQVLRFGFIAIGLTFLALAATFVPAGSSLLVPGLLLGFVGGILFLFSDDELPRYAGLAIVAYFALVLVTFLASNGITVRFGDSSYFANDRPPAFLSAVFDYLVLGLPILFVAASTIAVWELGGPRWLLVGALAGFALVVVLTIALNPSLDGEAINPGGSQVIGPLFSLAALAGAAGAFWASRNAADIA